MDDIELETRSMVDEGAELKHGVTCLRSRPIENSLILIKNTQILPRSMSVEIQELLFIVCLGCQIEEEYYNTITISPRLLSIPRLGLVWSGCFTSLELGMELHS